MLSHLVHLTRGGSTITVRELALLGVIIEAPTEPTVRHVSQHLGVQKPVITRAMDYLEANGLAVRRIDPADRRSMRMEATTTGKKVWRDFLAAKGGK